MSTEQPNCEMEECVHPATVYGGYSGAGSWAGYVCEKHAQGGGFRIWDRLPERHSTRVEDDASIAAREMARRRMITARLLAELHSGAVLLLLQVDDPDVLHDLIAGWVVDLQDLRKRIDEGEV